MQKHFFFFFSIFLFFQNTGQAQDVILTTQAAVDAFDTSITIIEGNLKIEGNDIVDLSNLSNIKHVGLSLWVRNTSNLNSLDGLSNVTHIEEDLRISGNATLQHINGLSNVTHLGGSLTILQNYNLQNVDGLINLTVINDFLRIESNNVLENIDGLSGIVSVQNGLDLLINPALENLDGLIGLTFVGDDLSISFNKIIENLDGLSNLISVEHDLSISSNDDLQNLDGLSNLISVGSSLTITGTRTEDFYGLTNLTTISGNLNITANNSIENFHGLENLTSVLGDFTISFNNQLKTCDGLTNLTSIGGDLDIYDNNRIYNLYGLENLKSVGGSMRLWQNDDLLGVNGLTNLTFIDGSLTIREDELKNLDGLESLISIGDYLSIRRNNRLRNIYGLTNLTSIGGYLDVEGNDVLLNVDSLNNLVFIGGYLNIERNELLQNIDGLENLSSIEDDLNIEGNDSLENLNGLADIIFVNGDITISYNSNLTDCCGIQQLFIIPDAISGDIDINNNPSECSSQDEIIASCEPPFSAQGCMYWDENQNGTKDENEKSISNNNSKVSPSNIISFLDTAGCYTHFLENGNYNLTYTPSPLWELTSDSAAYNITINNDYHTDLDFGFIPTDTVVAGNLHVAAGIPRCFREVEFDFNFRNEGTTILDGIMWGQVWDEWMEVTEYIQPPDTIDAAANGVRWGWFYEDLYPGELLQESVILEMPEIDEEGFELGDWYLVTSTVEANGHTGGTEFYNYRLNEEIVCAYDPNDKLVSPDREGDENYTLFEEDLFYTIRFQNTGNDTAFNVVVRDTLDENLNTSSFRLLASSHQDILRTEIAESQYVTFTFDNIMLPDSNVNFNGSQGYVTYIIQPNEGLDENTVIENTASIYFDFNPPIVTNTTQNTMVSCLPIETITIVASIPSGESYTLPDGMVVNESGTYTTEVLNEEGCPTEIVITILDVLSSTNSLVWNQYVALSPNPTKEYFIFDIQTNEVINHQLDITNIYGQIVLTRNIQNVQTKVNVEHLVSGVYWVQLRNSMNELVAVQKLMIAK